MKKILLLALPVALILVSCGDDSKTGSSASKETKESVRAKLPLYYDIGKVSATTSSQTVMGETADVSQLAIEVTLNEDLFITGQLSSELEAKLNEAGTRSFGVFRTSHNNGKTFLKKVASKGDSKTLYGELVTTTLPDGKKSIEGFNVKDASGKPMSAFNSSEVIIVGSSQEKEYVDKILAKHAEAEKAKQDAIAAKDAAKKKAEAEKAAKLKSMEEASAKELAKKKSDIISVFKTKASYDGVYKSKTGEVVNVTVLDFDPKFLHGSIEIAAKDTGFKTVVKISFNEKYNSSNKLEKWYEVTGNNVNVGDVSKTLLKSSKLAYNAKYGYLRLKSYKVQDETVVLSFGNHGSLMLNR